jgi:hypothetical protein
MTSTSDHQLLMRLSEELSRLFDVALLVEPPGMVNDAWGRLLAEYGVSPVDTATRTARKAQLDLARGALPEEVAAVVHAIAYRFAHEVGDQQLIQAAATTWQQTEATYLKHATYRPKSMFAFAVASAKAPVWQRPPGGFVARCNECGGPRLTVEGDLVCGFCGAAALKT